MASARSPKAKLKRRLSHIKRNEKGGILIEKKDLRRLFEFLDVSNKKFLTEADLRNRLSIFYKAGGTGPSSKEYKSLMNNRSTITLDDLFNILVDNELTNFDPIQESFRSIFDPSDCGHCDIQILRTILSNFGFNKISEKDMHILVDIADQDKDGKINLDDFADIIKNTENLHKKLNGM